MYIRNRWSAVALVLGWAGWVQAQPVVNGSLTGDQAAYGPALSIQNTDTQFGDAVNADPQVAAGGSEIDQVFGTIANGRLYMLVTGNLESNFNKLSVLIDSNPLTGMNQIDGAALPVAVDAFCCGGFGTTDGALQRMNGMTLDADFTADHFLTFSNGTESVGVGGATQFWAITAHYANLTNGPSGQSAALGMQINPFGTEPGLAQGELIDRSNNGWNGPDDPQGTPASHEFVEPVSPSDPTNTRNHRDMFNAIGLRLGIDNSNDIGVIGAGSPPFNTIGDPQNVTTGIEFSIPMSQLGNPAAGTNIKITTFVNGNGHHYASNQFGGDGVLQGNLGGDGNGGFTGSLGGVNLANVPGNQFVTLVVPAGGVDADFNNDGLFNCDDVNGLTANIAAGSNTASFDLTGDGLVNVADLDRWLLDAGSVNIGPGRAYKKGDANLDAVVDGSDFNIWNSNKFTSATGWCQGNFSADSGVDGSDFNIWNSNKFTASDGQLVPEPSTAVLALLGLACFRIRR